MPTRCVGWVHFRGAAANPDLQLGTESAWRVVPWESLLKRARLGERCTPSGPARTLLGTIPRENRYLRVFTALLVVVCGLLDGHELLKWAALLAGPEYQLYSSSPVAFFFVVVLGFKLRSSCGQGLY